MYPLAPGEALQLSLIVPSDEGHADISEGAWGGAAITSTEVKRDDTNTTTIDTTVDIIVKICMLVLRCNDVKLDRFSCPHTKMFAIIIFEVGINF
jgi:hypothetical protein